MDRILASSSQWAGFGPSYLQLLQIIRHIQVIVSEAKVNVGQCQLLYEMCIMLRECLQICFELENDIRKSLCEITDLVSLVQRAKYLIAECTCLQTAFLGKGEEFVHLSNGMVGWLHEMLYSSSPKFNGEKVKNARTRMEELLEDICSKRHILTDQLTSTSLSGSGLCFCRLHPLDIRASEACSQNYLTCLQSVHLRIRRKEHLGEGTLYAVYKGELFGMAVAAKEFKKNLEGRSYKAEARVMSNVNHPHMLKIFGWYEKGPFIYCVTELMETDLKKFLGEGATGRKVDERTAIDIMLQIAKAMAYLHEKHIIHGNLSLSNILVNANNVLVGPTPYVLIKIAGLRSSENYDIRSVDLRYMPKGTDQMTQRDKKLDVFSFGIICLDLLTGGAIDQNTWPPLPPQCRNGLKEMNKACRMEGAHDRPNFSEICTKLEELKREIHSEYNSILFNDLEHSPHADNYAIENCMLNEVTAPQVSHAEVMQMITMVQTVAAKAKINSRLCKLLANKCKQLPIHSRTVKESVYQIWELGNIVHRCTNLIRECTHVETAFLDKTAEFEHLFQRINYCCLNFVNENGYAPVNNSLEEFQAAAEHDLKQPLQKLGKRLMHGVITAIAKKGLLSRDYLHHIDHVNVLGNGSTGLVVRGKLFGMDVAIKRFLHGEHEIEFEIMGEVARTNPHLLQMIGYYQTGNEVGCVTQLMSTDLYKLIKKAGRRNFPLITAIDVMSQIAEAMSYLHNCGIMHRDLKLANVLVVEQENPCYLAIKVADFGLATIAPRKIAKLTAFRGTLGYMAPEMKIEDHCHYDKKVDVYSFGIMCAEILSGKLNSGKPPDLPSSYPRNLCQLIEDCWKEDPTQRPDFDTICTVLENLKKWLYFFTS